jgi:hypothetical protein
MRRPRAAERFERSTHRAVFLFVFPAAAGFCTAVSTVAGGQLAFEHGLAFFGTMPPGATSQLAAERQRRKVQRDLPLLTCRIAPVTTGGLEI